MLILEYARDYMFTIVQVALAFINLMIGVVVFIADKPTWWLNIGVCIFCSCCAVFTYRNERKSKSLLAGVSAAFSTTFSTDCSFSTANNAQENNKAEAINIAFKDVLPVIFCMALI